MDGDSCKPGRNKELIQQDGIWRPDDGEFFLNFHLKELDRDIPWFLANVTGRGRVIQAGGALGLYPLALVDHFQTVVTFEPDPSNWESLIMNVKARDCHKRVRAWNVALGDARSSGYMDRPEPWNIGAHRVVPGAGEIPISTIDNYRWEGPIDAIWLDVEGAELAALKGAEQTIRRFSPVIVTEENGNGARCGVGPYDIEDYLASLGYTLDGGIGNDRLYRIANG